MAVEIELKARLDDFVPVKERLSGLGTYCRSYTKSDSYWYPVQNAAVNIPSGVRLRRESGINADGSAHEATLVTYKTKKISAGIEVNDECEFTVSDAVSFEELLSRLDLRMAIQKQKQGWAWMFPAGEHPPTAKQMPAAKQMPILAELSLVAGLGWFLEIEIQPVDNDPQTVDESRNRLLALLEKLQVPAERIEARPYTAMLLEKAEKGAG